MVSSGSLGHELDLITISEEMGDNANYDPSKHSGMYIRLFDDAPLITVYRTGKYIITGANSEEETYSLRNQFLCRFANETIIDVPDDKWFSVQNCVCTGELTQQLNLNALTLELGLEKTEYEPEQFPGIIYRPENVEGVILLFATGKVIITGCKDQKSAEQVFDDLKEELSFLL